MTPQTANATIPTASRITAACTALLATICMTLSNPALAAQHKTPPRSTPEIAAIQHKLPLHPGPEIIANQHTTSPHPTPEIPANEQAIHSYPALEIANQHNISSHLASEIATNQHDTSLPPLAHSQHAATEQSAADRASTVTPANKYGNDFLDTFATSLLGPTKQLIDYLAYDAQGGLSRYAFICKATCNVYTSFIKSLSNTETYGQYQWRRTKTKLDESDKIVFMPYQLRDGSDHSLLPRSITLDPEKNLYLAYRNRGQLTKLSPEGKTAPIVYDLKLPTTNMADARVYHPPGITMDRTGNLYVTEYLNVYKITPTGKVTVIAGDGTYGNRLDDRNPLKAQLAGPRGIAVDRQGMIYITDTDNSRILKIKNNTISLHAKLHSPTSIVIDSKNNLLIVAKREPLPNNQSEYSIMQVTEDGTISTHTEVDYYPYSLTIDTKDNLYILQHHLSKQLGGTAVFKIDQATRTETLLPLPRNLLIGYTPSLKGIAVNPNGTSLYVTDDEIDALYVNGFSIDHNTVHGFHLGFPCYKNHIENTLTSETNNSHPDSSPTTTLLTSPTTTVSSSSRQTSHWKKRLALGGLTLAGITATALYLTNSIVDTHTNPEAPSRDHWNPAAESWLPTWIHTTMNDLQK